MTLLKAKICPVCKTLNPVREPYCLKPECGASLMNAELAEDKDMESSSDSAQEKPKSLSTEEKCLEQPKIFRICPDCGHHVLPNTWTCDQCGGKLYGLPLMTEESVPQVRNEQEQKPAKYLLRSEDGQFSVCIHDGESVIIGREAVGAEYLASKVYVGRKHLQVQAKDGWICLTDLSSTNGALVNGKTVRTDTPYKLSEYDLISLGAREGQPLTGKAAYFRLLKAVDES